MLDLAPVIRMMILCLSLSSLSPGILGLSGLIFSTNFLYSERMRALTSFLRILLAVLVINCLRL
jgi:hypothetical protein